MSRQYQGPPPGSPESVAGLRKRLGEVRDQAVEIVDGRWGYTVEFAPDPEQHRAEYDAEEERLRAGQKPESRS